MKLARGFTLIELLMVMAIIGLLSAITLSALNLARAKGSDSTIKAELNAVREEAEITYSDYQGRYALVSVGAVANSGSQCYTGTIANTMFSYPSTLNALTSIGGIDNNSMDCNIDATGQYYSVAVALVTTANTYWCIDNSGFSSNLSKKYGQPYTSLTGTCTSAGACAAHAAGGAGTVCQ